MIECYQGDTQDWRWKLTRGGTALTADELDGATATLTISTLGINNAAMTINKDDEYPLVFEPTADQTATAGRHNGTITVTFSDGDIETWPVSVRILEK
jgi:hypothetical protein